MEGAFFEPDLSVASLGGGPARAGWGQRGLVEGLPPYERGRSGTVLGDISHVCEGML